MAVLAPEKGLDVEVEAEMRRAGFSGIEFCKTLTDPDSKNVEQPRPGHGEGEFVVIKGTKNNNE